VGIFRNVWLYQVASFLEVGWVWVQSPSSCPTNLWAFNVANFSQSLSCGVDTVAVNVDKLIRNVATLQVPGESEDPEKGFHNIRPKMSK